MVFLFVLLAVIFPIQALSGWCHISGFLIGKLNCQDATFITVMLPVASIAVLKQGNWQLTTLFRNPKEAKIPGKTLFPPAKNAIIKKQTVLLKKQDWSLSASHTDRIILFLFKDIWQLWMKIGDLTFFFSWEFGV